jgi:hypothetical protein
VYFFGFWVWGSAVNFSSSPQTVSVVKVLNSSVGVYVAYMWNFSDHAGNSNSTGLQGFYTTVYSGSSGDSGTVTREEIFGIVICGVLGVIVLYKKGFLGFL